MMMQERVLMEERVKEKEETRCVTGGEESATGAEGAKRENLIRSCNNSTSIPLLLHQPLLHAFALFHSAPIPPL